MSAEFGKIPYGTVIRAAGVEFIPENGDGAGVRLRERKEADQRRGT